MAERNKGKRLVKYVPDYVVFDLETTGMSPAADEIIEISAVRVKEREIVDTFSTLVNPGRPIPRQATAVNGITDEMVRSAPEIAEALADFLVFIGDFVLVGHNIHSFDLKFIYEKAENLFGKTVGNDYIDTLYMARQCLPGLSHHKLVDVASYFHISVEGAHRALNDCIMNLKCYEKLAKLQEDIDIELCPRCGGEMKRRNGKFGEFLGCSNFPNCRYTAQIRK